MDNYNFVEEVIERSTIKASPGEGTVAVCFTREPVVNISILSALYKSMVGVIAPNTSERRRVTRGVL